jgi:hypothetical protein
VDVEESIVVEELVGGKGHGVADPHGGGVNLGAGPEVSMLAKVLEAMALL